MYILEEVNHILAALRVVGTTLQPLTLAQKQSLFLDALELACRNLYHASEENNDILDQFEPVSLAFHVIRACRETCFERVDAWEEVCDLVPDGNSCLHITLLRSDFR